MDAFTTHTGVPVPLRRANVDTDQIIPASYLKRITRTGFEDGLFASWRSELDFVLNKEPWSTGSILIVGPDFGIGSSREHAVWALQNYGFKVVIGSRFADIFRNNSGNNGLLLAQVDPAVVEKLWDFAEHNLGEKLTVSLEDKTISLPDGTSHPFVIDDATRQRLLAGLDAIGETLEYADDIAAYEARRPSFLPTTA